MNRFVAASALALLTTGEASSQIPVSVKDFSRSMPDQPAFTQGIVRRLRALDVDGNKGRDVAFVRGEELFFVPDLEVMSRFTRPNVVGVHDVAILPSLPGPSFGDVVLVVGPGGTRVLGMGPLGIRVVPLGAWSNVARVETTRHPTNPTHHLLVGLELNRTTLRLGCFVPTQGLVEAVAPLQIASLRDFALADWDGDGIVDVVVRTTGELRGYGLDGALLGSAPTSASSIEGGLTRVAVDGQLDRVVAANFDVAGSCWRFDVFRAGTSIDSWQLPDGLTTAIDLDLAAGDYDGDGCDDLLVQGLNEPRVHLFRHRGVDASYRPDELTSLDTDVVDSTVAIAPALFADINNDVVANGIGAGNSTADLVLAISSDNRLQCFTGLRHIGEEGLPSGDGFAEGDYPEVFAEDPFYTRSGGAPRMQFQVTWPEEYADATDLHVSVWRHDGVPNPLDLTRESNQLIPLQNWVLHEPNALELPMQNPAYAGLPIGFWHIDRAYYVTLRFVTKNAAGQYVATSPCYLSAYANHEDHEDPRDFQELYEYWLWIIDQLREQPLQFGSHRFVGAYLRRDVELPAELAGLPGL